VPDARQRRTILVAVCIALMAVIASVSGLNVAQPDLAVAFGASQSTILWIINIYTLSLAALLLPLGAIGDRWGRKPMLLVGLTIFGVASAAAGLAPSTEVMLAARLFSGVGAAMIMPRRHHLNLPGRGARTGNRRVDRRRRRRGHPGHVPLRRPSTTSLDRGYV
jgi:predicted MFS family arabinose efflux permease